MRPTRELLEAMAGLHNDPRWQAVLVACKHEREMRVEEMVAADQITEYQRAIIVGRIRAMQEFVLLDETAADTLRDWKTR